MGANGPSDDPHFGATLRELADIHSQDPKGVLTVYADLDPSVFPTRTQRQTEIDVLVSEAEASFVSGGSGHEDTKERLAAVEQLREALNDPAMVKGGTRSIAAFAVPEQHRFEILRLNEPVPPTVVVDDIPYLRPLAQAAGPRTWAVLLIDRRRARLLWGGPHRLVEVESFEDDTVSQTEVGGWSQANYQRHAGDEARVHHEAALQMVFEYFQRTGFDALAIAAPDPEYDVVVDMLHPYLRERLQGRIAVEISFPSPADVLEAARPVFDEASRRAIAELLDDLGERPRDLVAIGAEATLPALYERRVDTLIVRERAELSGRRCPSCGWLGLGTTCPIDQTQTLARDDLIGDTIDLALQGAARVVQIPDDAERQPPDVISALLRF